MAGKKEYRKLDNGMVYQPDWPYKQLFNFHLMKMKERGLIYQLQKKYWKDRNEPCESKGICNTHLIRSLTVYVYF